MLVLAHQFAAGQVRDGDACILAAAYDERVIGAGCHARNRSRVGVPGINGEAKDV